MHITSTPCITSVNPGNHLSNSRKIFSATKTTRLCGLSKASFESSQSEKCVYKQFISHEDNLSSEVMAFKIPEFGSHDVYNKWLVLQGNPLDYLTVYTNTYKIDRFPRSWQFWSLEKIMASNVWRVIRLHIYWCSCVLPTRIFCRKFRVICMWLVLPSRFFNIPNIRDEHIKTWTENIYFFCENLLEKTKRECLKNTQLFKQNVHQLFENA